MKNILNLIKTSLTNFSGRVSSTRIIGYSISALVIIFCLVFIGIELSAAIIALSTTGKYVLSNEIIIVFGSLLTQQITLLGLNKSQETKQMANVKPEEVKPEEPKEI